MAFISYPNFQVFDDNGDPLSGGKVYTYDAGTTDAKTTYSDNAMSVANSNPVVLDSRGECDIYCPGTLKLVIKTSEGVTVITQDNFSGRDDSLLQDGDGDTLIQVEESDDEDIIRFDIGGTEQITIQDGKIEPTTDDYTDLGSSSKQFKDAYIDGKAYIDTISGHAFPGFLQRPKFTYVESLDYDGGTVLFAVGETVTGAGAATGVVVALSVGATAATGTLYINTRNATAYVNDEVLTGSVAGAAVANEASSKNAIVISPFVYYHCGTTEQLLYSDSNIAYEFVALGTSDWSYLYFDDSAIVTAATNLITANDLIDNVDEPLYNVSKHGSYHQTTLTNDMCFFGVLTDGSDNIKEFFHDGGDLLFYSDVITDLDGSDVDTTWTDVTLTLPAFSIKANINTSIWANGDAASSAAWWRTNGQTGTIGHQMGVVDADNDVYADGNYDVIADTSQIIEVKMNVAGDHKISIYTVGWYFPKGM